MQEAARWSHRRRRSRVDSMHDSAKYLIHADITANGVVERNDVVGAIFGQTEGLLGEDLDLRELQDHSKVGRIDVDVDSEDGQSFGDITIASGLDRVETSLLAASLETIERVGPCRATIEVADLEDVRTAKRRTVVERATDLLADLEDESVTSIDIVDEVRQRVRVENVTEYEGYPAGPRVADSDAIIVVEGRADVLQLLQYGVKNAIAVEGTDVPKPVADLTKSRTVTAFLDGDRGGELILKELDQVGALDYVAFAPAGTSVEDLSRGQIMAALREKVPADTVVDASDLAADAGPGTDEGAADGSARAGSAAGGSVDEGSDVEPPTTDDTAATGDAASGASDADGSDAERPARVDETMPTRSGGSATTVEAKSPEESSRTEAATITESSAAPEPTAGEAVPESTAEVTDATTPEAPETVAGHAQAVIGEESGLVRLLDGDARTLTEGDAADAFDLVERSEPVPATVVVDDSVSQRLLDVAAQRGVGQVVGASEGEFVKRPTSVRIRTIDEF